MKELLFKIIILSTGLLLSGQAAFAQNGKSWRTRLAATRNERHQESSETFLNGKKTGMIQWNLQQHTAVSSIGNCRKAKTGKAASDIDSLISRAQAEGRMHVVVGLCVAFLPESSLTSQGDISRQRRAITRAQDRLLKRLAVHKVSSVKRYEFVPFIAMAVNAAALRFLKASPQVSSVELDEPASPTN